VAIYGTNKSTGSTIVSNGTVLAYGVINNPITVAGGTLSGTGAITSPVTVNAGTLMGNEAITGPVVINAGGVLEPGSPMGVLAISNTLTLEPGSSTLINLNPSTGATAQISGVTTLTFGGTLIVSNLSGALAAGNSFNVFNAASYSGAFSRITPSTPGPGLVWDISDLAASGVLRVISTSNAVLTAQLAGQGQNVALSWPANNLGWQLQTQTNPPGTGITTTWITVPGSFTTNALTFTVNTNVGSVFYRLVSPAYNTSIFAPGDLLVLQVGNGSISSSGAPGVLEDFSPFGGPSLAQVALPTSGASALIFGGSSYDGALSVTGNGQFVVIPGYNVPVGYITSAIDSSSTSGGSPVPRGVGLVNAGGVFTLGATTTQFSGSTIRSAVADGIGNFWAGGGSSGVVYLGSNSPATTVSAVSTSTRELGLANGTLYFTETGDGIGVMAFTGEPKNSATPALLINSSGIGSSPKGFVFNSGLTIAYVADNGTNSSGGGIQRFNWNGSSWVHAYTLANTATSSKEVEDLAVNFSGANPIIYAVTAESSGNQIIKATDTGAGSTFSSIETAASGDAFRGIVLAPASW
jgi:hypothetical protein